MNTAVKVKAAAAVLVALCALVLALQDRSGSTPMRTPAQLQREQRLRAKTAARLEADAPAREAETALSRDAEMEATRRISAALARDLFLDQGIDFEVSISGDHAETITFKYVLASAVWARKFQTGGLLDALEKKEFRRVELKNGYDYSVFWTFPESASAAYARQVLERRRAQEKAQREQQAAAIFEQKARQVQKHIDAEERAKLQAGTENVREAASRQAAVERAARQSWKVSYGKAAPEVRAAIKDIFDWGVAEPRFCEQLATATSSLQGAGQPPDPDAAATFAEAVALLGKAVTSCHSKQRASATFRLELATEKLQALHGQVESW